MSNAFSSCQVNEYVSVGRWFVRGDCVGRRDPPSALCDSCADNAFASSVGTWAPDAPAQSRRNICRELDAAKYRDFVVGDQKSRRDPSSVCRHVSVARPWMVELRRAPPTDFRTALVRVKKYLPPRNSSGLEDVLG